MPWSIIAAVAAGFAAGLAVSFLFRIYRTKTAGELAEELFGRHDAERRRDAEAVVEHVKASFGSLSLEALSKSTEEFLKLAKTHLESERQANVRELEARKDLIDQELRKMAEEVDNVGRLMRELEKDRVEKFGELTKHLQLAGEQTALLAGTTASLKEALAGTKARGQWGERMAEDILRAFGFVENVNYLKQKTIQGAGGRPDFTFLLPRGLRLNMDVKFPFDNYMRFLDAEAEGEKARFRAEFLRDVKAKIKEVATRDYINPEQEHPRLRAPSHRQRAGLRLYPGAGQPRPRRGAAAARHLLLADHAFRGPRSHQAGSRCLLHGRDVERDTLPSWRLQEAVGRVPEAACRDGQEDRRPAEGLRGAERRAAQAA